MRSAPGRGTSFLHRPLLLCLVLAACVPNYNYNYKGEPDPRNQDYVLGVSDTIRINVWKSAELSTDATIRPDGTVTMPLVGDIKAAGKTTKDLQGEIVRRLGAFLRAEENPVTIAVTNVNSYRFTISGNVEKPGTYTAKRYLTVSDALAEAGGPNKFASADKIVIVRTGPDGTQRRIPIALSRILTGARPDMDIVILSGDRIIVP